MPNPVRPLLFVFLLLTAALSACWFFFGRLPVDYVVLLVGNVLVFVISAVSGRLSLQAMKSNKTQGFLKGVYGSFLLKFFVLAAAALAYIANYRQNINKPAFFGCFGLYLIYTFMETRGVMRQNTRSDA